MENKGNTPKRQTTLREAGGGKCFLAPNGWVGGPVIVFALQVGSDEYLNLLQVFRLHSLQR